MLQIVTAVNHICFSLSEKQGFRYEFIKGLFNKIKCLVC